MKYEQEVGLSFDDEAFYEWFIHQILYTGIYIDFDGTKDHIALVLYLELNFEIEKWILSTQNIWLLFWTFSTPKVKPSESNFYECNDTQEFDNAKAKV